MKHVILISRACIVHDGKVLVVKRANNDKYNPGKFTLPGGKIELGETPEEACIREAKEETNLDVEILKFRNLSEFRSLDSHHHIIVFEFLCKAVSDVRDIALSKEHAAFDWVDNFVPQTFPRENFLW